VLISADRDKRQFQRYAMVCWTDNKGIFRFNGITRRLPPGILGGADPLQGAGTRLFEEVERNGVRVTVPCGRRDVDCVEEPASEVGGCFRGGICVNINCLHVSSLRSLGQNYAMKTLFLNPPSFDKFDGGAKFPAGPPRGRLNRIGIRYGFAIPPACWRVAACSTRRPIT